jgi:hypothetical protein
VWAVPAVFALGLCGLAALVLRVAHSVKQWGVVLGSGVPGGFCAWFAWHCFQTRNDSTRFYADRAETFRGRRPLHRLVYADVHRVAYGFREGAEFLSFSGPGGKLHFTVTAFSRDAGSASGVAVTPEKLQALRDQLYDVVAARMRRDIEAGRSAAWFGPVAIRSGGLLVNGKPVPWEQVKIASSDQAGEVAVVAAGRDYSTSMVEDNVTAGLIVVRQLQSAPRPAAGNAPANPMAA